MGRGGGLHCSLVCCEGCWGLVAHAQQRGGTSWGQKPEHCTSRLMTAMLCRCWRAPLVLLLICGSGACCSWLLLEQCCCPNNAAGQEMEGTARTAADKAGATYDQAK